MRARRSAAGSRLRAMSACWSRWRSGGEIVTSGWAAQRPASGKFASARAPRNASASGTIAAARTNVSSQPVAGAWGSGSESARVCRTASRLGDMSAARQAVRTSSGRGARRDRARREVFLQELVGEEDVVPLHLERLKIHARAEQILGVLPAQERERLVLAGAHPGHLARSAPLLQAEGEVGERRARGGRG